jgi:hypothetical protein
MHGYLYQRYSGSIRWTSMHSMCILCSSSICINYTLHKARGPSLRWVVWTFGATFGCKLITGVINASDLIIIITYFPVLVD